MKYRRTIIAAFGDTHGGNNLGLLNPETVLEDGHGKKYSPKPNETQRYIYELYKENVKQVFDLADGDDVVALHLGDSTQGIKYLNGVDKTSIGDQIVIAEYNMHPWYDGHKNLKAVRLVAGTSSHVFGDSTSERTVDRLLQCKYSSVDTRAVIHAYTEVAGITLDLAHHGPSAGKRFWLKGNNARLYLQDYMLTELSFGRTPAHIVFRGHYHSYLREFYERTFGGKTYGSWIITLPSYCGIGEFAVQVSESSFMLTNGMVACEVINGQLHQTLFFGQTIDTRTREKIL